MEETPQNQFYIGVPFPRIIQGTVRALTEPYHSGSSYVPGSNRLLLVALALSLRAQDILETGYNTGMTTLALATTGARVTALDNMFEQPEATRVAHDRLKDSPNVLLVKEDALLFLANAPAHAYDLIFLDDCHWPLYTLYESYEAQRVLRPGGCVVFHDTTDESAGLWHSVNQAFPAAYERINLPSWQGDSGYSGDAALDGCDFGLGIVRKPVTEHTSSESPCYGEPWDVPVVAWKNDLEQAFPEPRCETGWLDALGTEHRIKNEEHDALVPQWIAFIAQDRRPHHETARLSILHRCIFDSMRIWGMYCSERASSRARARVR